MRFLFLLLLSTNAFAIIKVPSVIQDNMVLQRNVKIPVWGWGAAGEQVEVSFKGKKYQTITGADGKWSVKLNAAKAGGPYEMVIRGENTLTIRNILLGDVFICSGQSNMERTVTDFYAEEIATSANDRIRQFKVEHQNSDTVQTNLVANGWKPAMPTTVKGFTAAGYFFARDLYAKYGVPIGLINTSYGSALAEAWMSREGLKDFPDILARPKVTTAQSNPTVLYNAMLAPLTNYAVKGVLWYQGEFNKSRAFQYRTLFPALIRDWRAKFGREDLPFVFVQLPNYDPLTELPKESATAELREAQAMTLALPYTAMAVTIETNGNTDLHPKEKKPVGIRMSLAARKLIYGEKIVASGPVYRSFAKEGNKIVIRFDQTGGGLTAKNGELKQFAIAGADKKFVWATATIKGNQVEVYSPEITEPVAVRYAWADNPMGANLYNQAGLPAAPFRTDDWPGVTQPKKK